MYGPFSRVGILVIVFALGAAAYACGGDDNGAGGGGGGDASTTGGDGGPGGGDGGGDGASTCSTGSTACGSSCVNLQSNDGNCGACGHDCLGGGCQSGACLPARVFDAHGTDAGVSTVGSIAVDGKSIYWVTPRVPNPGQQLEIVDCAIFKCPLGSPCTTPKTVIAEHEIDQLLYVASTSSVLYYTDAANASIRRLGIDGVDAGASVGSCASGGSPCALTGEPSSNVMTSDGTNLYWGTNYNNTGGVGVYKAAIANPGTPTKLGPASGTTSVVGIALDPGDTSHLWTYTVDYQGNVHAYRNDQSAQAPQVIAASQGHPGGVVVASAHLFWSNPATGQVLQQDACTSSGCKTQPANNPSTFATVAGSEALTADATHLYWTAGGGRVLGCPLAGCAGGQPQELARVPSSVHVIATDANAIYFGDELGGVWRLAK